MKMITGNTRGRNTTTLHFLVVLVLLMLFQGRAPAQQQSVEGWESRFADQAAKWRQYSQTLCAGRVQDAGVILRDIEASLKSDQVRDEFWNHVLPAGRRQTVLLLQVCQACTDGRCKECRGAGVCATCKGEKKCPECGGVGVRRAACTLCLCVGCKGTGFCSNCLTQKSFQCAKCEGKGYSIETESSECKKCGGVGKVAGGFNNELMRPCAVCNGRGKFEKRKRIVCPGCQGRRTLPCPLCNGSGKCSVCQGRKRIVGCSVCKDTRTVSTQCSRCAGAGKCPDCAGKPSCIKCGGTGKCTVCEGEKFLRVASVVADSTWMNHTNACLVQTAANYVVDGVTVPSLGGNSTCGVVESTGIEGLCRGKVWLRLTWRPGETICISDREDSGWLSGTLFKVSY
ncbi:MAG: hypothetical protein WCL44_10990 [bacterium]